jgi:hypothetical protein
MEIESAPPVSQPAENSVGWSDETASVIAADAKLNPKGESLPQ